jgi:hypothetical protein
MTKYVNRHTVADGSSLADVLLAVLQYQAKDAATATAVTDSSTGAADSGRALATVAAAASNTANSGTNLADKTTTEAAMGTVRNSIATLAAKLNTALTVVGITNLTDSTGGSSGGNTLAAMTKSVTAATTGVPASAWNAFVALVLADQYNIAILVNKLCAATGQALLNVDALKGTAVSSTLAAISTATGTAADPGTTKARVDADLTVFANNAATIVARLNACISGANRPAAVAASYVAF